MAKQAKPTPQDLGQLVLADERDLLLTLKPAELEALLVRLCACSTRRVRSAARRRVGRICAGRARSQWCGLGSRAAAGYVGTRFG